LYPLVNVFGNLQRQVWSSENRREASEDC